MPRAPALRSLAELDAAKFGVISALAGSNTTSTGMSIASASGVQSTI
jgi:hypothetical protein